MLRRPGLLVAALAAVLALTGCGAAGEANPEKYPPTGVDELVIPTPDPDPTDFVAGVDNHWLPLAPGTVWTYDVTGSRATSREVRVEATTETIANVPCVVVHRTDTNEKGRVVDEADAFYAQDAAGNVWLFGEDGPTRTWRAGVAGAEAGLAMPATPRVGDGFLRESAPGVAADRSTVLSLDAERTLPAGTFRGLALFEDQPTIGDETDTVQRAYASGTGLVQEVTSVGGAERAELVSVTQP
jgi:hypothetical protein